MLSQMRQRVNLFWVWIGALLAVIAVGAYAVFLIMYKGLVVTNLTDGTPWGLWIILDLSCIGVAAGAFRAALLGAGFAVDGARRAAAASAAGLATAVLPAAARPPVPARAGAPFAPASFFGTCGPRSGTAGSAGRGR